jgi:hypothetical protein
MLLPTLVIAILAACTTGPGGSAGQPPVGASPPATTQAPRASSPVVIGPSPSSPIASATPAAVTLWSPPVATLPASSGAAPEPADIPGLTRAIVRLDLQTRGFTCADQRTLDGEIWDECRLATAEGAHIVVLRGLATTTIRVIDVTALGEGTSPSDAEFALLEAMAGVPCTGCERSAAREWVRRTAAVGGEATIGPLDLQLYGDAATRVLQVRAAADQPAPGEAPATGEPAQPTTSASPPPSPSPAPGSSTPSETPAADGSPAPTGPSASPPPGLESRPPGTESPAGE